MRPLRPSLILLGIFLAAPAYAANTNPPEIKDAQPEARENVQEKSQDGVVQPPANVDPKMKTVPPPATGGTMPVIPPPTEKDGRKIEPK